jgi:hypothetical protein
MAAELLGANYATTTVGSGGYSSGATHLNVISTSTGTGLASFPATGNFRVTIFNQSTGAPEAILLVTAIASGTQFTTTAEVDGNASAGDIVLCTLTESGIGAILAQMNQTGPFASLPTIVPFAGAVYNCTDAPYEFISNGSAWQAFYNGRPATLPPTSSWTSINLTDTGAVANYTFGYGYLIGNVSSNSDFLSGQRRSAPGSTPYSFVARMQADPTGVINSIANAGTPNANSGAGSFAIGFSDGTKYVVLMLSAGTAATPTLFVTEWNTSTSVNTSPVGVSSTAVTLFSSLGALWFKIRNDGTDIYFQISLDGNTFYTVYSQTITAFLSSAADVFWGLYGHSNSPTIMLLDWTQGT